VQGERLEEGRVCDELKASITRTQVRKQGKLKEPATTDPKKLQAEVSDAATDQIDATVLDFGKPSISDSIRSIKMYS
jgi:hypothetical protein